MMWCRESMRRFEQRGSGSVAFVGAMAVMLLCGAAGCSFLIDKKADQCEVDADCVHFGGHPACQQGVCVATGLGPEGCVVAQPGAAKTQSDYLNACSTSKCVPFDNCKRLGLCSPSTPLPAPTTPQNQTIPPLLNPVPKPTNLCTDGAPGPAGQPNMIYLFGSADFGPLL